MSGKGRASHKPTPEEKAARKKRRKESQARDALLVENGASGCVGMRTMHLASEMRRLGVTDRLTVEQAKWARDGDPRAPLWLRRLIQERDKDRAAREERAQAERAKELAEAYELVSQALRDNDRKLRQGRWLDRNPAAELALHDIAFRAAKDCGLASGDPHPDWACLREEELTALRICGYDVPTTTEGLTSLRARQDRP